MGYAVYRILDRFRNPISLRVMPKAKPPTKKTRVGSKSFNMRIPWAVWDQLEAAAGKRGVSVASMMLSATTEKLGLA